MSAGVVFDPFLRDLDSELLSGSGGDGHLVDSDGRASESLEPGCWPRFRGRGSALLGALVVLSGDDQPDQ